MPMLLLYAEAQQSKLRLGNIPRWKDNTMDGWLVGWMGCSPTNFQVLVLVDIVEREHI